MSGFPLVHPLLPAPVNNALGVAQDNVRRLKAHGLDKVEAGDPCRPRPVADQPSASDIALGDVDGVDHSGGGDDGGAMLIVMKHRMSIISRRRSSM